MDGDDYRGEAMDWKHLLAYITGTVDQELLLRNEYLVTENRILRNQLKGRIRLSDGERKALAVIGQKLGKQALKVVAQIVKPDTILGWHRKLVAQKFDGSQQRQSPGRPPIDQELEALIVRIAQENRSWGYDRIVGALANLGLTVSADFRGAKSTHIPHCQPHRFSRNADAFCEVLFHLIDPKTTLLLRCHHRIIASRGLAELPGRRVQWLSARPRGNGENTSHWSLRVPGTPLRTCALL
jgi:hypothetical protein